MTSTPTPQPRRIYLKDGELVSLMHATRKPVSGHHRVVPCGFGPGAVWIEHPAPRWIYLHLAVLRGIPLKPQDLEPLTDDERAELEDLAASVAPPTHEITIVASPKFDAPGLVAAQCSCNKYRSAPTTENKARKSGAQHVAEWAVR